MTGKFKDFLSSLSLAFGPSGCECRVAEIIKNELSKICDCSFDKIGNLICHLPGKKEKLMITAPMDETGFMVTDIDDKGYIRVSQTGNADPACFLAKRFNVGNETELFAGFGGGKVLHLLSGGEHSDSPNFDKLFIDGGFENKDEVGKLIEKGDFAAYQGEFFTLPGGTVVGKALEARALCAVAVETLKKAAKKPQSKRNDIFAVFTVKEKAGKTGAVAASYAIAPDKAVFLSYAPSCDLPKVDEHKKGAIPGNGVVLPFKDGSVLFYDSPFFAEVKNKAESLGVPFVLLDGTVNNPSGKAHLTRTGIPSVSLRLPCYNPETPLVIMKESDIDAACDLLTAVVCD